MKLIIEIPDHMIKALEQGSFGAKYNMYDLVGCVMNGTPLDDIRAEILKEKECAYADFERYKIEYLGVDEETVMDELPNDEYRYGMERCLEIIGKHIKAVEE